MAAMIGISRNVKGTGKAGRYGVDQVRNGWQIHCDGACGEAAVAKAFGLYWDGSIGDFGATDVGEYQVRTNPNEWGDLILHERDNDADPYILVLSHGSPDFNLRGWIYGSEGKLSEYWRDGSPGRPAFFVPQDKLRPIEELITGRATPGRGTPQIIKDPSKSCPGKSQGKDPVPEYPSADLTISSEKLGIRSP